LVVERKRIKNIYHSRNQDNLPQKMRKICRERREDWRRDG
tara:strand:- start:1728 stop:1847 length:120 start_codon:yes stop_codon:yes gene_type:complete